MRRGHQIGLRDGTLDRLVQSARAGVEELSTADAASAGDLRK